MNFTADEKALAMATAYKVLVGALVDSGSLKPDSFMRHAEHAVTRTHAIGQHGAASALAELLDPIIELMRQPDGTS